MLEPIWSTSRQFPGVNASTSGLRRGFGGRLNGTRGEPSEAGRRGRGGATERMSPAVCGQGERYGVRDDEKSPTGDFSFLHRRGAFFLFDKAEKKEWGSQKRRALDWYIRMELNGTTPVPGRRAKHLLPSTQNAADNV